MQVRWLEGPRGRRRHRRRRRHAAVRAVRPAPFQRHPQHRAHWIRGRGLARRRSWRAGGAEFKERLIPPLGIATRLSTDVLAVEDTAFAFAIRFIREHACHGITVDDVLKSVPLSRMSLERRFRKYLGHSPHAEIRAVQLARAKQLLVETEHPIHRIAQLVGFEHPEYFNVLFKREVGQPPGQFRQEARCDSPSQQRAQADPVLECQQYGHIAHDPQQHVVQVAEKLAEIPARCRADPRRSAARSGSRPASKSKIGIASQASLSRLPGPMIGRSPGGDVEMSKSGPCLHGVSLSRCKRCAGHEASMHVCCPHIDYKLPCTRLVEVKKWVF